MTTQQPEAQERKFWKRLCALNRFSFFYMGGGVARASDKSGNWIEVHSAQEIVDDAECEVSTQHARITELESQLAQRFDAADMATAAAQGFRDGVASVAIHRAAQKGARGDSFARFAGQHKFLEWNREQGADRPMFAAVEYAVFQKAVGLYLAALASTPAQPVAEPAIADSALEDAACWHWLAEYLVGTRTDLDDEIVASETVNDLRKLVKAAIKQGATK